MSASLRISTMIATRIMTSFMTIPWLVNTIPFPAHKNRQLHMMQQSVSHHATNHKPPLPLSLGSLKHLINFAESDPAAGRFFGLLLTENLKKMVEFTTARGLVETPIAESPTRHAFDHRPTAVITSYHCPTSRKRKCHRLKIADEYSKKNKHWVT
jgi:hypothetical protein